MKKRVSFREWMLMREEGTSTSSIATFARPIFNNLITRGSGKIKRKKKKTT